jgi:hypothetical protein
MLHKNTRDMSEFSGEIEIDESYFGGARNGKRGKRGEVYTAIINMPKVKRCIL